MTIKKKIILTLFVVIGFFFITLPNSNMNQINQEDNKEDIYVTPESAESLYWEQWSITWRKISTEVSQGYDVAVDSKDNAYVVGHTDMDPTAGLDNDMCLIKYNGSYIELWNQTWGGSNADYGFGIAVDSEDNVYVVGRTNSFGFTANNISLVKYNSTGHQLWNATWGGSAADEGKGIAIDSKDNIYVVGSTQSYGMGDNDICLIKYNASGTFKWNETWGGTDDDEGYDIAIDSKDNIYIAGYTNNFGAVYSDMCLLKYNSTTRQKYWNITCGEGEVDIGNSVAIDSQDNIYLAGFNETYIGPTIEADIRLFKYNSSKIQLWNITLGGDESDSCSGVTIDSEDNAILTGRTISYTIGGLGDMFTVKFNGSGIHLWNKTWGGSNVDVGLGVAVDSKDSAFIAGQTLSYGSPTRIVTVKYAWELPGSFDLYSHADAPESDGVFKLNWTSSFAADVYTVYEDSSPFSEINGQTIVQADIADQEVFLTNYDTGTYYFLVLAINDHGNRTSENYVSVQVTIASDDKDDDDDDDDDDDKTTTPAAFVVSFGNYYLLFTILSTISLIIIVKHKISHKS